MTFPLSLRGLASRLFHPRNISTPTTATTTTTTTMTIPQLRPLSTTNPLHRTLSSPPSNKSKQTKNKRKKGLPERDPKVVNMLQYLSSLSPKRIPPPLRMARNRHLRHWTIHRAWLTFRRREREAREANLMRQHQSISAACEALRLTTGPGSRDEGYLYRVAMEKKGVYGLGGIPIEYARAQTDTPAREPWNHEWKR
ncbi:hypothetical protein QBC47DRAFT_372970 [Echria macrotheca]|uniref:Large ribosomal subunit protein mL40 n=1 Tax=Echria macrotheca TaxID=438768 RepID=A0AAJ0F928_9PEZI|nr:hypothetical protein QBC47DRAFT_372970 [Echria macrotheca]